VDCLLEYVESPERYRRRSAEKRDADL